MSNIVGRWSLVTARLARQAFELSSTITDHNTIIGDARESFIRNVLSQLLPENVHVGTGQIVDHLGSSSRQIDVVLYRKDFPILRTLGQSNVYLVEGVVATMEVKSTLNKEKLWEALENGKSVRNLQLAILKESFHHYASLAFRISPDAPLSIPVQQSMISMLMPPHYIFGYRGYEQKELHLLKKHIDEWFDHPSERGEMDASTLPEIVASHGCIGMRNHENACDLPEPNHAFAVKTEEDPLKVVLPFMVSKIIERLGSPTFGPTGITYALEPYLHVAESTGSSRWEGCAFDMIGVRDPKLYGMDWKNETK